MARVTDRENRDFHRMLDTSIMKLGSDKNINKAHWSLHSSELLKKMLAVEVLELDVAIECNNDDAILLECDDIINFAMFIKHNINVKHGLM